MTRNDDLGYPILVGDEPAEALHAFVEHRSPSRVVVLCDRNVAARAERIAKRLRAPLLPFALGERRKRWSTVEPVLDALAKAGADRRTLVVGVGGGVAGDLFGFAAAVYMRGVAFANVATSLVAMVDAAVGGKTGVDLRAGKNLAGAFADPKFVFCDVGALATLAPRHVREGLAELIKHGIIEGADAFAELEELMAHPFRMWPWERVVAQSVAIKAMVVGDDRLESGRREVLNLGHTFGHAIERVTAYRISHGNAVAMGLRAAGLLALRTERFSSSEHLRVLALLALAKLPVTIPSLGADDLLAAMATDKKARAGELRFVLPRAIGEVEFGVTASRRLVRGVLARAMTEPGAREFR